VLANKVNPTNLSSVTGPLTQGMNFGINAAQQAFPTGMNLLSRAAQALGPVQNFFGGILGNRGQAMQAAAPAINQMNQGYAAQNAAQQALMPRGGGRSTLMAQMPYQQMGNILSYIQNLRNTAASGLQGVAGTMGGIGSSAIGGATQALNAATSAGSNLLQNAQLQQQLNRQTGGAIGNFLQSTVQQAMAGMGGGGNQGIPVASPQIPDMSNPANWPGGVVPSSIPGLPSTNVGIPSSGTWGAPVGVPGLPATTGAGYNILGPVQAPAAGTERFGF
jgi:hypothetical protein